MLSSEPVIAAVADVDDQGGRPQPRRIPSDLSILLACSNGVIRLICRYATFPSSSMAVYVVSSAQVGWQS